MKPHRRRHNKFAWSGDLNPQFGTEHHKFVFARPFSSSRFPPFLSFTLLSYPPYPSFRLLPFFSFNSLYFSFSPMRFVIFMTDTWRVKRCIIIIRRKYSGDNIPFPTPFRGSAKRKCGFFPQRHGNRVNCRCNHNFIYLA